MQQTKESTALVWFRNDLRVDDNLVLQQACKHRRVIAVYCFNPKLYESEIFGFKKIEKFRARFLLETIRELKGQLAKKNIALFTYFEHPENVIPDLVATYNIETIYLQKEWTQEEVHELQNVKQVLSNPIVWHEEHNQFLFHPEDIPFTTQDIPKVFTVFRKRIEKYAHVREWKEIDALPESNRVPNPTSIPSMETLGFQEFNQNRNSAFPFKGGETQALNRLNDYFFNTKKLGFYKKTRNGLLGVDYSSKFSPWLANGSISARTIYWHVKQFEKEHYKNQSTYWLIFELIWRDFFKYISLKNGNAIFKIDGILNKTYDWHTNAKAIIQWIHGNTAEPFVNANMIELKETGWMSNRGRQNVASFFAKTQKLDWRIGAAYFESMLLDYDVHSNYGNWMYVAGVGNDPRDRVFNVKLQAERYDANGKFQNLWLQPSLF